MFLRDINISIRRTIDGHFIIFYSWKEAFNQRNLALGRATQETAIFFALARNKTAPPPHFICPQAPSHSVIPAVTHTVSRRRLITQIVPSDCIRAS